MKSIRYYYLIYQNILLDQKIKQKYFHLLKTKNFIIVNENNLIFQDKNLIIDIPQDFILEILNSQYKIMSFDDAQIKKFMKLSKHFRNIKKYNVFNGLDVAVFNFADQKQVDKFHYTIGTAIEQIQYCRNEFYKNIDIDCYGFYSVELNFLFINSKYSKQICYKTCYHQLSHYFQQKCDIRVTSSIPKISYIKNVQHLFNQQENIEKVLNYWFSPKQFYAFIDDLILNLRSVKQIYFQKLTNHQFIKMFINKFSTKNTNILNDQFILKYKQANGIQDISCICMFICSYILKIKYQKFIYYLNKAFQNSVINYNNKY